MTREIHDINTKAVDFVVELIDYIAEYPYDDYMTMECLCRKLVKHGLIDKVDGRYEPKDEPQTDPLPKAINGVNISDAVAWADKWLEDNPVSEMWDMIRTLRDATEWQDEPQIFTWGKEVHEFCKMKCNKSKARSFDGDRFIVCGQSNDAICINLPACPLGKWITGKGYHILPMDEPQTEAWKEPFETDCSWK